MRRIKKAFWLCIAVLVIAAFAAGCSMFSDNTEYAVVSEEILSADGRFYYDLYENGAVTVTGRTAADNHMNIPSNIDGHPVTAVGSQAFQGDKTLKCVTFEGGIKTVNSSAFVGCTYLTKVDLGGDVRLIGDSAFDGCIVLCEVVGIEKLEYIDDFAFAQCASLSFLEIPESVTHIGEQAFFGCTSLTTVKLPDGECTVGEGAFSHCESLCRAELGGITAIPAGMFENCFSLVSINIGKGIDLIGDRAFRGCTQLGEVYINKNVKFIGSSAFDETPWLNFSTDEFLIVGDGILLRYNGTDTNVTIPANVKLIGDAFCGNADIRSVSIGGKVKQIGDYAFVGCIQLSRVTIDGKVERIGISAFGSCLSLTSVYLTDSIKVVDEYAFGNCGALLTVDYGGSRGDWAKIDLTRGNECLQAADISYSAGRP
ncbi:MAG: leucine-rich repeat domain-containing protein [Clostridia bacterium]|nr:leucine-rich repeat domain-containing protein [Clostridia bacterium]